MIDEVLVDYLKIYHAKGYSYDELKKTLLGQDYPEENIKDSMNVIKQEKKHLKEQEKKTQAEKRQKDYEKPDVKPVSEKQMKKLIEPPKKKDPKIRKKQAILFGLMAILVILIALAVLIGNPFPEPEPDIDTEDFQQQPTDMGDQEQGEQDAQQPSLEIICGECQYKVDNECKNYVCCNDAQCDDKDNTTSDRCDNPKTLLAKCTYTPILQKPNVTEPVEEEPEEGEEETTVTQQYCTNDDDCDDGKPETQDICREDNICIRKIIRDCIDDDGYCPAGCDMDEDNDCDLWYEPGKCRDNDDCDDDDNSTEDFCIKQPTETYGICDFAEIRTCRNDDDYCPVGCYYEEDSDCNPENQCSKDGDCDDDNSTTVDSCSGEPRACIYTFPAECIDDDDFCPVACTNSSDNDCGTKTSAGSDSFKTDCGEDIFCYKNKIVETEDKEKCEQILWYWNDPIDYFVSSCLYDIARALDESEICGEISNEAIKTACENYFSI